jgi:hypothetical protein
MKIRKDIKLFEDKELLKKWEAFPSDQYEIERTLVPRILEAFRDFEMAAYNNNLQDIVSNIKVVFMDKISKCIELAEELKKDYIKKVIELLGKKTEEETFEADPRNNLPPEYREKFKKYIISEAYKLAELFTSKDFIGDVVEEYWQLYAFDTGKGKLTFINIGKFKTYHKYIVTKERLYFDLRTLANSGIKWFDTEPWDLWQNGKPPTHYVELVPNLP